MAVAGASTLPRTGRLRRKVEKRQIWLKSRHLDQLFLHRADGQSDRSSAHRLAALPYRMSGELEVLLITSLRSGPRLLASSANGGHSNSEIVRGKSGRDFGPVVDA